MDNFKRQQLVNRIRLMETELLALIQELEDLGYEVQIKGEQEPFMNTVREMEFDRTTSISITATKEDRL